MHGHQVVRLFRSSNIADPRPFGIPTVGAVVAMTGVTKSIKGSIPVVSDPNQQGFRIPTRRPKPIGFKDGTIINSSGARYFYELISPDSFPVFTIPLIEGTGFHVELF